MHKHGRKLPANGFLSLSCLLQGMCPRQSHYNISVSLPHVNRKCKGIQTVIDSLIASNRPSLIPATFIISSILVKPPLFSR